MKEFDAWVIGAGISGIATAKCMQDAGYDTFVLERSGDIGGLWFFRPKSYGVMKFTHMYVYLKILLICQTRLAV